MNIIEVGKESSSVSFLLLYSRPKYATGHAWLAKVVEDFIRWYFSGTFGGWGELGVDLGIVLVLDELGDLKLGLGLKDFCYLTFFLIAQIFSLSFVSISCQIASGIDKFCQKLQVLKQS